MDSYQLIIEDAISGWWSAALSCPFHNMHQPYRFSKVLHCLSKYAVIHQLLQVLLEATGGVCLVTDKVACCSYGAHNGLCCKGWGPDFPPHPTCHGGHADTLTSTVWVCSSHRSMIRLVPAFFRGLTSYLSAQFSCVVSLKKRRRALSTMSHPERASAPSVQ